MTRKLGVLGALLLAMALSMGAQTVSPSPITVYCVLTATGYCPNTTGAVAIKQGIDTHNVYIVPEGTPGTITVLIQGSVIGDFTDAATCGTSTTTTANLLSCSGIYAAIRVRVSVMTVFTSVKLFYVGTSTVAKNGGGGAVSSVTGAGTVSCSPTTGAVTCTGSGGLSVAGSSGDLQMNSGSSTLAAAHINDNGSAIYFSEPTSFYLATAGSGGVTQNLLAAVDASAPSKFVLPASGNCGVGFALTSAIANGTFLLGSSVQEDYTGIADNNITAGHILVGGTSTPGRVRDSAATQITGVPVGTCIVGKALATATTGNPVALIYMGLGTFGTSGQATYTGSPTNGDLAAFTAFAGQIQNATAHNVAVPLTCADSSGSGTVQSCTSAPSFTPASGDAILYSTTTTNTGDVTVNVNSLGAKHIRKNSGATVLASGDLVAATPVQLIYDGTYWEIPVIGNAPSGGPPVAWNTPVSLTMSGSDNTLITGSPYTMTTPGADSDYTLDMEVVQSVAGTGGCSNGNLFIILCYTSADNGIAYGGAGCDNSGSTGNPTSALQYFITPSSATISPTVNLFMDDSYALGSQSDYFMIPRKFRAKASVAVRYSVFQNNHSNCGTTAPQFVVRPNLVGPL
jgi:hypothetical protein